jgi:hypothetical protein
VLLRLTTDHPNAQRPPPGTTPRQRTGTTLGLQATEQDFTIANPNSDFLRKQDYRITVEAGLEFRTFEIALVSNVGLANISTVPSNGFYTQNRLFRIDIVVLRYNK